MSQKKKPTLKETKKKIKEANQKYLIPYWLQEAEK